MIYDPFAQIRNNHYLNSHTIDAPYACPACPKKYKVAVKLAEHRKMCMEGVRYDFGLGRQSKILGSKCCGCEARCEVTSHAPKVTQ